MLGEFSKRIIIKILLNLSETSQGITIPSSEENVKSRQHDICLLKISG
jgi:hypothetical protein